MDCLRRIISKIIHTFCVVGAKMLKHKGVVYMLHSIGDDKHVFNVSVSSFESLLTKLIGKNVIRLKEWRKGNNFVCLTFDDVADSFYYNAFPLLKYYQMPFTIFVSCSLLDCEKYITTEMLKEIAECELCTIGSHGWQHSFFVDLSKKEAIDDLMSSKCRLEELTGKKVELFAFPYGSIYACGLDNKRFVTSIYKYGFSTIASPITSPMLLPTSFLPRIKVDERIIINMK